MSGRGSGARGRVRVHLRVRASVYVCVCARGVGASEGGDVQAGALEWPDGFMFRVDGGDVDAARL